MSGRDTGGSGLRTGKTLVTCWIGGTQRVADTARRKPRGCDGSGVHCTQNVYYGTSYRL